MSVMDTKQKNRVRRMLHVSNSVRMDLMLQYLDTTTGVYSGPSAAGANIIAGSGGLSANDIVYVSNYDSTAGKIEVLPADADTAAKARDIYWTSAAIADGVEGFVFKQGSFTSALSGTIGDPVYLSPGTAGEVTLSEPTGTDVVVQIGTLATSGANGVVHVDLGGERIMVHNHEDRAGGGTLSTPALAGTTSGSWTVNSGAATPTLITTVGASTGDFDYTITIPTLGSGVSNTYPTGTGQYFALTSNADGSISTAALTGTTNTTFEVDAGGANTTLLLSAATSGASGNTLTLIPAATFAGDYTVTLPDPGGADSVVYDDLAATLANKILTDPTINAATITGNITITTPTIIGTWANLGTVNTIDIDGGSIDDTIIGANVAAAIEGTVITGTTLTDGTATLSGGAFTGTVDLSGATVIQDWDGAPFTGAIAKDTDLIMIDNAGTKQEATYQVLMNGVNDLASFATTVVPATDTVLIDDDGIAKSATYQAFMDGLEDLTAAGAGAVVADKLVYLDGGVAENITVQNLFDVSDLTGSTGSIDPAADELFLQDAGTAKSCTYQYLMDGIDDLAALAAAPALTDSVLLDDGGVAKKNTIQFLLDAAGALAADTVADGDSFMLLESGGVSKKEAIADLATLFAGTGLTAASSVLAVTKPEKVTFLIPGTFLLAGDFYTGGLAGLDETLDITATEQTAALAKSYNHDNTKYANINVTGAQGEWTANYQLFPDAEVENDAVYFGGAVPFCELWFDMSATVATYNGAAASQIWEYADSGTPTWTTLNLTSDSTDVGGAGVGQQPFGSDGCVTFVPPADWTSSTVDSQAAYWIRCRCTAAVDITQTPLTDSLEHHIVTPTDGAVVPFKCNITGIRATDGIVGQMHTTTDVKLMLMNFTKGTYSLQLTWPQDKRTDRWTGTDLKAASAGVDCDAGDVVGFLCTQADGAQEITNAVFELDVTASA